MTVINLINLLQKVEHKEVDVYLEDSEMGHMLSSAAIEHDLSSDEIVVVLKTR